MSDYINAWRKEHGQIVGALSEVSRSDIFSEAGQKKLRELERMLEAHLYSEDRDFYPVLGRAAQTDAGLKLKLAHFASDMEQITEKGAAFFRRHKADPSAPEIPAEFGRIAALLKSRISREESLLMSEFEKLEQQKAGR